MVKSQVPILFEISSLLKANLKSNPKSSTTVPCPILLPVCGEHTSLLRYHSTNILFSTFLTLLLFHVLNGSTIHVTVIWQCV